MAEMAKSATAAHTGNYDDSRCSTFCHDLDMTRTIPQRELRNDNAKVIDAVTAGETFVVTRNGEPVAELQPVRAGRRTFISARRSPHWRPRRYGSTGSSFGSDLDRVIDQAL